MNMKWIVILLLFLFLSALAAELQREESSVDSVEGPKNGDIHGKETVAILRSQWPIQCEETLSFNEHYGKIQFLADPKLCSYGMYWQKYLKLKSECEKCSENVYTFIEDNDDSQTQSPRDKSGAYIIYYNCQNCKDDKQKQKVNVFTVSPEVFEPQYED